MPEPAQKHFRAFLSQYDWHVIWEQELPKGTVLRAYAVEGQVIMQQDWGKNGHQLYLPTPNNRIETQRLIAHLVEHGRLPEPQQPQTT